MPIKFVPFLRVGNATEIDTVIFATEEVYASLDSCCDGSAIFAANQEVHDKLALFCQCTTHPSPINLPCRSLAIK